MTVFLEYVKDQECYIHTILSDAKPMIPLSAEQQVAHAKATICAQCGEQFTKKNRKTKYHCHLSSQYIGPYCHTCNLKLMYKRGPHAEPQTEKKSFKRLDILPRDSKSSTKYFRKKVCKEGRGCDLG